MNLKYTRMKVVVTCFMQCTIIFLDGFKEISQDIRPSVLQSNIGNHEENTGMLHLQPRHSVHLGASVGNGARLCGSKRSPAPAHLTNGCSAVIVFSETSAPTVAQSLFKPILKYFLIDFCDYDGR
jgi:hypothetical protein